MQNNNPKDASTLLDHPKMRLFLGLLFCCAVVVGAQLLSLIPGMTGLGLGPQTMAILLGIVVANVKIFDKAIDYSKPGIDVGKDFFLKASVILYGFRLVISELIAIGLPGFLVDVFILITTFLLTVYIGTRFFKIDKDLAILIGSGSSICGAAAVLATEPLLKADTEKVSIAVGITVVYGTICIFLYPWFLNTDLFSLTPDQFSIFAGSTIHSVSTTAAATADLDPTIAAVTLTTKLMKVAMLAPFLLTLGYFLNRAAMAKNDGVAGDGTTEKHAVPVPWFAVGFLVAVVINSYLPISDSVRVVIQLADNYALMIALVSLGLTTHMKTIRQTGPGPLLLGLIIFAWLIIAGVLAVKVVYLGKDFLLG